MRNDSSGEQEMTLDLGDMGEQDVLIKYDIQPYEARTHDDPGCDASVDITEVVWLVHNLDITAHLSVDTLRELETIVLTDLSSGAGEDY